jgi:hypothetical protein
MLTPHSLAPAPGKPGAVCAATISLTITVHTGSTIAAMPPKATDPVNRYIVAKATTMWTPIALVVIAAITMGRSLSANSKNRTDWMIGIVMQWT